MLAHPQIHHTNLSHLRLVCTGAAPTPTDAQKAFSKALAPGPFCQMTWGMTELTFLTTVHVGVCGPWDSIGKPLAATRSAIFGPLTLQSTKPPTHNLVKYNGAQIPPYEIEALLFLHPSIHRHRYGGSRVAHHVPCFEGDSNVHHRNHHRRHRWVHRRSSESVQVIERRCICCICDPQGRDGENSVPGTEGAGKETGCIREESA
jgi:hypothetical protein